MKWLLVLPFGIQAVATFFDEFYYHYKRGLPRWERLGHPLDTLTVLACLSFIFLVPFSLAALKGYIALAFFSLLFVTKDEFVHARLCCAGEHWLHALLFVMHPIILVVIGLCWAAMSEDSSSFLPAVIVQLASFKMLLLGQFFVISLFFFYQIIYWNFIWRERAAH